MSARHLLLLLLAASLLMPSTSGAAEPGDVVITEMLIASGSGEAREWIEVLNPTSGAVDLTDCELADATGSTTLGPLVVAPQSHALLSKTSTCVVYDAAGTCVMPADLVYSSITLNNGTDSVTITCEGTVIDSVSYDWGDLSDDCVVPEGGHCSVNLDPAAQTASGNDAWPGDWCVPPATEVTYDANGDVVLATPGAAGVCPQSGPACGPGDLIFTEFMVDPPSSSREWFEMKVRTGSGCDIHGCEIWEGTWEVPGDDDDSAGDDDDSAGDDDDDEQGDWAIHSIDASGDTLFLSSGTYALFSKTHERVAGEEGDEDAIFADYVYSSVSLQNSDPAFVRLVCDGVEVDVAPYDKATFEGGCPDGGCSNNLRESSEDEISNDELKNWCLPPLEPEYLSSDGLPFTGTPGQPGACIERDWPVAGEVLISEIMVQALDKPEWFEVVSKADRDVDLGGCELRRVRLDQPGGTEDPSALQVHTLGSLGESPTIPADGVRVFSKGDCLDGTEPSGAGTCLWREEVQYTYATLSFTNGEPERVSLYCPSAAESGWQLIDSIEYDATRTGNRTGHSLEFDVTLPGASDLNDNAYAWCDASFFDCVPELTNEEGECNYGTPGEVGPCQTGALELPESGPGCICDGSVAMGGSQRPALAALLFGLTLVGLRRRQR